MLIGKFVSIASLSCDGKGDYEFEMNRPNIILITVDDQRYGTINALGNKEIITPNLDELAKTGTSFIQAHIPGGTTGAVCMPSRAMIHTGKNHFNWSSDGATIPDDHTLLGEALQQEGYTTFATGKWHNGTETFNRSFSDGENIFFGGMWDHWNVPVSDYDQTVQYDNIKSFITNPMLQDSVTRMHCDRIYPGKHSTDLFAETAIDWLDCYQGKTPFFMNLAFMSPHDPRNAPRKFMDMYDPDKIDLPINFVGEHPFDFGVNNIRDEVLLSHPRKEEDVRTHIAQYYAMITHHDDQIGQIITKLKQKGLYENTIVVFLADHGLALGQHGLLGKQNNYDHSVRVPLILSGPGIPENELRDSYVYHFDIFPTLCDLIGIEIPTSVEGISMLPVLNDQTVCLRDNLYFSYADKVRATKDKRYKLIEYIVDSTIYTQLFDLHEDPAEMNNLYDVEGYEEIIPQLREQMQKFRDEWNEERHPTGKAFWENYRKYQK
ncbi:choline-sulfatase [Lederbergia ruris]|uniref:Choline-sulfatase n=2 Tax=Lederbergia ruris TaxID=217495 RepID=A0ABQ4KFT7_9BACI|nr:choline-sulfatase [Lederbergia ruris]